MRVLSPPPPPSRRPAPSRWLPLQGPSCFMPERAATTNMGRLGGALQALQDEGRGRSEVLGLAGQLLHAGRQDRAAQVRPVGGGRRILAVVWLVEFWLWFNGHGALHCRWKDVDIAMVAGAAVW